MEVIVVALHYTLSAIMAGVAFAWVFLIKSMAVTFTRTPYLDRFDKKNTPSPRVSIIVPARNEEAFVGRCLASLIDQDYSDYEIVAIDDSSDDRTGQIIKEYAEKSTRIVPVTARPKPNGWMGKNWACMEGVRKATGQLLLFTDADTRHSQKVVSLAVSHLGSLGLDALTVIPKMASMDWWTRVTLPMISTFLHTWFSAVKVNDPAKKTGYFFGSFFIIKKETYEGVGMHEGVRQEIIEDGALGRKVKDGGYKLRMVKGEHLVDAVWARDRVTLWNALKRLMVPFYLQNGNVAVGIFFAVLFLLFMPFVIAAYAAAHLGTVPGQAMFWTSIAASALIYAGGTLDAKKGLSIRPIYSVFAPVGSLVVVLGFLAGLVQAKSDGAVSWRDRRYSMKDHKSSISIQ